MSRSKTLQNTADKNVSEDIDTICKVAASKVGFQQKGQFSIQRINDTLYMADFQGPHGDSAHVDLDCVEFSPEHQAINLVFDDGRHQQSYVVADPLEYEILMEAKAECDSICDLKLRLNSLLRDVYFSGLYSTLKTDQKLKIAEEVEKLRIEAPNLFFSTLPDRVDGAAEIEKERHAVEAAAGRAVCAFCFKVRAHEKDLAFVIHPYVPKTFQGQTIYMCSICVENWKEYRDAADHHQQLILENEVNEEVCAVCSDTPETLVLCSGCPRSFCHACLNKILSKNDQKVLTSAEDADWQCMCCANGIDALPLLSRDSWVRIRSVNAIENDKHKKRDPAHAIAGSPTAASPIVAPSASVTAVPTIVNAIAVKDEDGSRRSNRRQEKIAALEAAEVLAEVETSGASVASESNRRGGRPHHRRTFSDEMDVTDNVVTANSGGRGSGGRGKRKYQEATATAATASAAPAEEVEEDDGDEVPVELPPISSEFDELYYFSQYVRYIDNATYTVLNGTKKEVNLAQTCTDDSCFLCKDGGELIECDWRNPNKKKCRCLKVYHQYCLEYEVADGVKWSCPRHFCDVCGSQTLKYVCKYCTLSICANCPAELVKRVSF